MKKNKKLIRYAGILFLLGILLGGCAQREVSQTKPFSIYYMNKNDTKVVSMEYTPINEQTEALINECIVALSTQPSDVELKNPIASDLAVMDCTLTEGQLRLNFNKAYYQVQPLTEVLRRAAIVRTLSQIDGVESIIFTVEDSSILDSKAQPIGAMTADTFLDNTGAEINTYERTDLHLYFADSSGAKLVSAVESVAYSSNISMEKLVTEHIISGPRTDDVYPTVSSNIKVISVTAKDGTCYVNLSQEFLTKTKKVSDEAVIYSFVNSLTELPNINKVQFMIDGESEITFGDHIYLSAPFERNLEIVAQ